jgi:hypothetical protein
VTIASIYLKSENGSALHHECPCFSLFAAGVRKRSDWFFETSSFASDREPVEERVLCF